MCVLVIHLSLSVSLLLARCHVHVVIISIIAKLDAKMDVDTQEQRTHIRVDPSKGELGKPLLNTENNSHWSAIEVHPKAEQGKRTNRREEGPKQSEAKQRKKSRAPKSVGKTKVEDFYQKAN